MTDSPIQEGELVTFTIRVNDGPEELLTVRTGIYALAAVAVPAVLGYADLPISVAIWVPHLEAAGYKRLYFIIDYNEFGSPVAKNAIPHPPPRGEH